MVGALHHLNIIWCASEHNLRAFLAFLRAAVDGHEEMVATALHIEFDDRRVGQHDGTHIQRVRGNGRHREHLRAWNDDRTSIGEGIGRRTRRTGNDQTVGLIGVQILAVDAARMEIIEAESRFRTATSLRA